MERWLISLNLMKNYFKPRSFEFLGKGSIYSFVGVQAFKRYVPTSGDVIMRLTGKGHIEYRRNDIFSQLLEYEEKTRKWEYRHWIGMILFVGIAFGVKKEYSGFDYVFVMSLFLLLNVYPIILQRHNRLRIVKLFRRFGEACPYDAIGNQTK